MQIYWIGLVIPLVALKTHQPIQHQLGGKNTSKSQSVFRFQGTTHLGIKGNPNGHGAWEINGDSDLRYMEAGKRCKRMGSFPSKQLKNHRLS